MVQLIFFFTLQLSQAMLASSGPLSHIEKQIAEAEYSAALVSIAELKPNLLTLGERARLFWLKGVAHSANGEVQQSKQAFLKVLQVHWWAELEPNTSPKIMEAFGAAKRIFLDKQLARNQFAFTLTHTASQAMQNPIVLSLKLKPTNSSEASGNIRIKLNYRAAGSSFFTTKYLNSLAPDAFHTKIHDFQLGDGSRSKNLEFFYSIYFKHELLFRIGSSGSPFFLSMLPSKQKNLGSKKRGVHWGVWAGAGTAVVGSIIASAFLLSSRSTQTLRVELRPPELK